MLLMAQHYCQSTSSYWQCHRDCRNCSGAGVQLTDRDDPALHRAPDGRALSELSLAEAAALLAQQPRAIG